MAATAAAVEVAKLGFRTLHSSPPTTTTRLKQFQPSTSTTKRRQLFSRLPPPRAMVVDQEQEVSFTESETQLIDTLLGIQGRGRSASPQQLKDFENAVKALESQEGVPDPTSSSLIEGRWQLIFTTRPGTASPIQRTFVGVDFFSVFQEVYLRTEDPRVSNIVKFSDAIGELKVEAVASSEDGKRILFRFDRAAFSFKFLPFKVPYPVPFKLLGDEAKGWLDTTYLSNSGNIRISRGNKGTTFVLQKKTEPRQKLLSAISTGAGIMEAIDNLISLDKNLVQGELELLPGKWQLIWSSQTETDSWIENAAIGLMGMQVVRENGRMKYLVDILLGIRFSMDGTFVKSDDRTYDVTMDDAAILAGPFGLPIEMKNQFNLELLYADDKIRITRGLTSAAHEIHHIKKCKGKPADRKSDDRTYDVTMDDAAILAGPFGLPIEMKNQFNLELLYADDKIRITRGYNQIIFVHLLLNDPKSNNLPRERNPSQSSICRVNFSSS